jgi:hypothetical protein
MSEGDMPAAKHAHHPFNPTSAPAQISSLKESGEI